MTDSRKGVLFLCVANSARSQMAEGLARAVAPEGFEIYSAGSAPSRLNPFAVEVMRELGIDISSHRSKSVEDVPAERIGTAITLCDEEVCPVFPGNVKRLAWPFEDPAAAKGSDEEIRERFRQIRDQIRVKIQEFFEAA
jgi:arsenate reductase (thioredoxin)